MAYQKWYPAQAHTRDEVIKAMEGKRDECLREADSYNKGLQRIQDIFIGKYYELSAYSGASYGCTMFALCKDMGRDHVGFEVLSCSIPQEEVTPRVSGTRWSLSWNGDWKATPSDVSQAIKYVSFPWITTKFSKLFKEGK
ncbi:MAG: hypothetical protein LUQ37_08655 [Methanoregulaceae archaeon]|nr:hypothetical protein [Methanoregulaceae archaeon]